MTRKEIKEQLLSEMNMAGRYVEEIRAYPDISREKTQELVHLYVCAKFLLPDTESSEQSLLELSQKSIEKAIEMKIPIAKESERATTCGAAGSVVMKNALLFMALKKDLQLELPSDRLGAARNTKEIGNVVYDTIQQLKERVY